MEVRGKGVGECTGKVDGKGEGRGAGKGDGESAESNREVVVYGVAPSGHAAARRAGSSANPTPDSPRSVISLLVVLPRVIAAGRPAYTSKSGMPPACLV